MAVPLDAETREKLERALATLDGVLHASIDRRTGTAIWVVRDPEHHQHPIELAVRNRLATLGHDPSGLSIRITTPTTAGPRRRVRFEGVERVEEGRRVSITVALEWDDVVYSGEASGERGPAIEFKTTARAAIAALESLIGESLDLRIIGVKQIHAFDSDLMVASLYRSSGTEGRLVGTVVVKDDPHAAAAVAVLSAVNRMFGNFLHAGE